MELSLRKGDLAYLLRRYIKTKRSNDKLDFKKLRLYRILERIGPVNYRLKLPVKSKLHPIFHVSLLEPAKGTHTPDAMEIQPEHKTNKYKIEKILDERQVRNQKQYLVKWFEYPSSENTWESIRNLRNCQDKLREYRGQTNQESPKPARPKESRRRRLLDPMLRSENPARKALAGASGTGLR